MRFWCLIGLMIFGAVAPLGATQKTIQLKIVKVRKTPTLFAPMVGELSYLQEVKVLETQKGWSRIVALKNSKVSGWVQNSAMTVQTPVQIKAADRVQLSEGAVTLAGKGFSSDHEEAMKQKDQKLDFGRVDQVETIEVSDEEFKSFVANGGFKAAKKAGKK